jgi:hypothetical protein
MDWRITSSYIHHLQAIYHRIDNRGLRMHEGRLKEAQILVEQEINRNCALAANQWNCHVFVGAENALYRGDEDAEGQVNLNSTSGEKSLLTKLQLMGYKVPKISKRNAEGEYESRYSTAELALQKMLVENQYNYPGGDPAIRAVLAVRELTKLRSSYLYCDLYKSPDGLIYYLSNYNAGGTLTGRRSSRKHSFGFGNNAQNFPKHGKMARIFRRCIVARPGNVFLSVDQKSAEEWPVSALAKNYNAITEMQNGVNRHIKRAAFIFGIPEASRTEGEWKDALEYYLGKKTGHANNYGMQPPRMSDSLAQEGHSISPIVCKGFLDKLNFLEPEIRGVFHAYVKDKISKDRILRTPFGRERQFLGLRPDDNNYKLFNEAFAYIPQSTVGDNTGIAVYYLETTLPAEERAIVQEGHDSVIQDIPARPTIIWRYLQQTVSSFDREIKFDNGITVNIPVEAELSYDLSKKGTFKIKDLSYDGVVAALKRLNIYREEELEEEREQLREAEMSNIAISI